MARIVVNVAYSYAILQATALEVQKQDNWINNPVVQKLEFSNKWVKGFLNRCELRKRTITRDDKPIATDAFVVAKMKEGHHLYEQHGHSPGNTWNMDETAVTWAIGTVHMYVPPDQQRASNIGIPNTKLRITAVICVNGLGDFAPLMFIVKHSVSSESRPDQSGMSVLKKLHKNKDLNFREVNGWELILWTKTMTINNVTADHKCWYLIHNITHHVITSQHKAWNDQVRMMMWVEIIMNPIKERDRKALLWFDNCGCHKTASIEEILSELDIKVACLPPNMTAILQVLDLVVNGPLKAHIRNSRAKKIVKVFKEYKVLVDENALKIPCERKRLIFKAPKPDMFECIEDLIHLFGPDGSFQKEKFKNGISTSFQKTGTTPISVDANGKPTFITYNEQNISGVMKFIPLGTQSSEWVDEVSVVSTEHNNVLGALNDFIDEEDFGDAMSDNEDSEDFNKEADV